MSAVEMPRGAGSRNCRGARKGAGGVPAAFGLGKVPTQAVIFDARKGREPRRPTATPSDKMRSSRSEESSRRSHGQIGGEEAVYAKEGWTRGFWKTDEMWVSNRQHDEWNLTPSVLVAGLTSGAGQGAIVADVKAYLRAASRLECDDLTTDMTT